MFLVVPLALRYVSRNDGRTSAKPNAFVPGGASIAKHQHRSSLPRVYPMHVPSPFVFHFARPTSLGQTRGRHRLCNSFAQQPQSTAVVARAFVRRHHNNHRRRRLISPLAMAGYRHSRERSIRSSSRFKCFSLFFFLCF